MATPTKRDPANFVMDKQWEEIQKKTFTKWCNSHLLKKGYSPINSIAEDFENGIKLMEIVSALYGISFPAKYNKAPKMRPQVLDNIQLALAMLDSSGVKTNFLKPFHLADKDLKMLLGMIWAIILDYQIKGISVEEVSAKEGLLLWCKRKTHGYRDVNVENFTTSWQDGLAFLALIHKHRPDLLDYDQFSKNNPRENLQAAFEIAETKLGITRLLDVEDIVDVARPDERSIVTYVSQYFHCFSSQDQVEVAGRRIAKFVKLAKSNEELKNNYLQKAQSLVDWILENTVSQQDRTYDNTLQSIEIKWDEFKNYKKGIKPEKTNEKLNVEVAFNSLQALLRVNNRPAFVPPEGLSLEYIEKLWSQLGDEETKRAEWIRREMELQHKLEQLASRFWRKAAALLLWGQDNSKMLSDADYGQSVAEVEAKLKNHEGFEANYLYTQKRLDAVKQLAQELFQRQYGRANDVNQKLDELDQMWINVKNLGDARRAGLLAELERQNNLEQLRLDFAKRSRSVITFIEDAEDGEIAEPVRANSIEGIKQLQQSLVNFLNEYSKQEEEYTSLAELSQSMTAEGIINNPYASFTIEVINERWSRLQNEISERQSALNAEEERLTENDRLCKEFAQLAKNFTEWVEEEKVVVTKGTSGTLEEQLNALQQRGDAITANTSISELIEFNNTIDQRNIVFNPYTEESIETLQLAFDNLVDLVAQQTRLIEKEILNQSGSKVSEEQLAEFKETFKAFDKDASGTLEKHEFAACLKALGQNVNDEQVDRLVRSIGKAAAGKINFQEFVEFMVSKVEDSDSPSTVKNAFRTVAGDKDWVTEEDLRRVPGLQPEVIEFLLQAMPSSQRGLNYGEFTESQYKHK